MRVDLGSTSSYVDTAGNVWQADKAYTPGSWGWDGQAAVYTTTAAIGATDDETLYQTERWWSGPGGYRVDLPNGDYKVWLHLAEIYPWATRGTRVFSVAVEGQTLLRNIDAAAAAGQYRAYDMWANITVRDGRLDLDMLPLAGNAAIKAIAVYNIGWCQPSAATATPTPLFDLRINAGGAAYTDSDGRLWQADQMYTTGGWGAVGGAIYTNPTPITGSDDGVLYQSHRWWNGNGSYKVTVPNGTYQVGLRFAEIYAPAIIGSRVFDVRLEGAIVRSNVDVMSAVGKYKAYDLTFSNVVVSDGVLNLDLMRRAGSPAVSGIEIVTQQQPEWAATATPSPTLTATAPAGSTLYRVNAGGDAYMDVQGNVWSADQAYTSGDWGYVGGMAGSTVVAIANTEDAALYHSERWWEGGTGTYKFTLADGVYDVELRFAETYRNSFRGSRVFDIKVEGQLVRSALDIVSMVGMNTALDITVSNVVVRDGVLQIDLSPRSGSPKINAIRISAP